MMGGSLLFCHIDKILLEYYNMACFKRERKFEINGKIEEWIGFKNPSDYVLSFFSINRIFNRV